MRARLAAALVAWLAAGSACKGDEASATAEARSLWNGRCARCHGERGMGETALGESVGAPNMTFAAWQRRFTDEDMRRAIREGFSRVRDGELRTMPGQPDLSPGQIDTLVQWVRSLPP